MCDAHLNGGPLTCTQTGPHHTHTYVATTDDLGTTTQTHANREQEQDA